MRLCSKVWAATVSAADSAADTAAAKAVDIAGAKAPLYTKNNFPEVKKMAVKIRLRRLGAKKKPFYRVVVADSRYPRDGRFIEEIGYYDATKEPSVINIDQEKAKSWIANGAQPTDTVKALLKRIEK